MGESVELFVLFWNESGEGPVFGPNIL
jgi:hypothetical protein